MKKKLFLVLLVFNSIVTFSQNTIGTLTNEPGSYNGYTLFSPNNSTKSYLINNCGEIVHHWTSTFTPGSSVYLLENGNLLRTGQIDNPNITFGGVGGKIELFDWDNNLLWDYSYSSNLVSQHHDIYPLPNGNVLMLAVSTMTQAQAIAAGRDPSLILDGKIFNEQIIELEPILGTNTANIVWEWNIKDHIIQDFDNTKANFGVINDHPELLDFNFLNNEIGHANWLHLNSLQYNENLDQIILSSRLLSELYIIDHSTTTTQAASSSGGNYGKGGDFLFRWGNPKSYDNGNETDQRLFSQHHPHWIPDGLNDAGKIMVFNNGNSLRYSSVDIFTPTVSSPGVYEYDAVNGYGPSAYDWTYVDPVDPQNFFSSILSNGQRLPNGNTLICDGDSGYFFEIDQSKNIVWEYRNPDTNNGILSQGDTPSANFTFRAKKFALDYPAFIGRDLTPGNPIELNPDLSGCSILSISEITFEEIHIYPNPTNGILNIKTTKTIEKIDLFNMLGKLVLSKENVKEIDLSNLVTGIYIAKIYGEHNIISKKIIKQ
ncbi:T9SS type A sorting domain-containing protein [Lacinutrix sp. WUR7]|uniref:aryl-sulfate sulfotransferase n=1 Tax=Lacinutrix sp. WUR7 TaxID=2653681 RepID=UPI00193CFAE3|nr:aryl-sulfate sulfotransferase [Lacinutrix sp. WUR7]QRM88041.1 T9SS type A sorting domain-containing protein [Lacinutrix sp. WUR7]